MIAGRDYQIVSFDPERHGDYLFGTFLTSVRDAFPWSHIPRTVLADMLKRVLAGPDSRALVALADESDEPADLIAGWAVAIPRGNELVYGFVRHSLRRQGIGGTLALAAGVNVTRPVGVRFWSRACERIALRHGWPLYHRITDDEPEADVPLQRGPAGPAAAGAGVSRAGR